MLKWPEKARRSVAAFFVKWNDFDVFVEDTAKFSATIYCAFLGRIVDQKCKVASVFPLGDRKKVLEAAIADTKPGGRRRIYLVDGDLDLIAGLPPPIVPRLYVHDVYHLENYFLCPDALTLVLHEENPRFDQASIRVALDFQGWLTQVQPLTYLFAVFGLTRVLDPSLPTIKLGIGSFCTKQQIDEAKIRTFCDGRMADLRLRFSTADIESAQHAIDQSVRNHPNFVDLISAREFLLPTLRWWIAKQDLQLPAGKESLLFRLSKSSEVSRHSGLVAAVGACATARSP